MRGLGQTKFPMLLDSGATYSVTPDKNLIHGFKSLQTSSTDFHGGKCEIVGTGYLVIDFDGYYIKDIVYYAPSATETAISEYSLIDQGCDFRIISRDPVNKELIFGMHTIPLITYDRAHYLPDDVIVPPPPIVKVRSIHSLFGHVNARYLIDSVKHSTIQDVSTENIKELQSLLVTHNCDACLLSKATRAHAIEGSKDKYLDPIPFSMVYSDVCQVNRSVFKDRPQYYVSFKCAYTGYTRIFPISSKAKVHEMLSKYVAWVNTQFGKKVKGIFTDQGSEYLNSEVKSFLNKKGIEHHYTSGYTPSANGVAERLNLTILNDVRAMLYSAKLPAAFWAEAAIYSVLIRNHIWSRNLGNSPAGKLGLKPLSSNALHYFGELVYVTSLPNGAKTESRSEPGIYLGYDEDTFGASVFIPTVSNDLSSGKFVDTRNLRYLPKNPLYTQTIAGVNVTHFFGDEVFFESLPPGDPEPVIVLNEPTNNTQESTPNPDSINELNFEEDENMTEDDDDYDDHLHGVLYADDHILMKDNDQVSLAEDAAYLENTNTILPPNLKRRRTTVNARDHDIANQHAPVDVPLIDTHVAAGNRESQGKSSLSDVQTPNPTPISTTHSPSNHMLPSTHPSVPTAADRTSPPANKDNDDSASKQITSPLSTTTNGQVHSMLHSNLEPISSKIPSPIANIKPKSVSPKMTKKQLTTTSISTKKSIKPLSHKQGKATHKPSKWNTLPTDGPASRSRHKLQRMNNDPKITVRSIQINANYIPNTYNQAMNCDESTEWKAAVQEELNSHKTMKTWLTEPIITSDPKILSSTISTRWVFAKKADGRFKGRLVARGDRQPADTFNEVYSPTLRPEIARSIFSCAVSRGWYLNQYDFTTAYLNSTLDTSVYIHPPQGFNTSHIDVPEGKRVVYKLHRGLYGLKQAGRLWHETISQTLKSLGFRKRTPFPSTFVKHEKGEIVAVLGIFVDDMIFTAKNQKIIDYTIKRLMKLYKLKEIHADKNGINTFLGVDVKITRGKDKKITKISLSQETYIKEFVETSEVEVERVYSTPLPPNFYVGEVDKSNKIYKSEKDLKTAKTLFKSWIGSLLYASIMTRPDITYAVNYLARFSDTPHPDILSMIKRTICYLYSTSHYKIIYARESKTDPIICYTDSDYAQDVITRKSMNGFLIYTNGHLVHWKSKYTPIVCTSSDQAEQQALYLATNELDWFRPLLQYMGNVSEDAKINLMVDNKSAIYAMTTDNFGSASKHYAVRTEKLKERYQTGIYNVEHISGELELADIMTKPISVKVAKKLIPLVLYTQ